MFYRIIVAITLLINAVSDFKTRTIFSIYFLGAAAFGIFVSDYKMAAILTEVYRGWRYRCNLVTLVCYRLENNWMPIFCIYHCIGMGLYKKR